MARIPANQQMQGPRAQLGNTGQPAGLGVLAPGREVRRVTRKELPDGRVLQFLYQMETYATPAGTYVTWELVQAPALGCPCTPQSPDDVAVCSRCQDVVCVRRHSATCAACGKVFCSGCSKGVTVQGVRAIVCKACADELAASPIRRVLKAVRGMIWG